MPFRVNLNYITVDESFGVPGYLITRVIKVKINLKIQGVKLSDILTVSFQ
jgi:hypothetical protein